ncbi:MAG: hypothetical protein HOL92_16400, partial [Opitutales bacterium]|nr:hypothetical protein [Opitutales bacterium]
MKYEFHSVDRLPDNPMHPDPFLKPDGSRVLSLEEWPAQREYLKALVQRYLYGSVPPRPTRDELSVEQFLGEEYNPPDTTVKGRKE